jgi:hypothetical protein
VKVSENGILKIIIGTKRYEETGNVGEIKLHNAKTFRTSLECTKFSVCHVCLYFKTKYSQPCVP